MAKRKLKYSGIGGQAVLEGIMMKNKEQYAVAVRKPDGEIEVEVEHYHSVIHGSKLLDIPFVRGVFQFIDSLVLGMRCLNFSASFYEDEEAKETAADKAFNRIFKDKAEKVFNGIVIFVGYVLAISLMKDIRRVYMYHGAEHKCINCIEKGAPLTVKEVMRCSKQHRRCGTSFLLFVMFVSVILFFFIRVENPVYRILIRVALIPVIAGISYEIIRLAGKSNNILVRMISAPGMWLQRLTTREPDESMVEVAIAAVEAVFDWKGYIKETFGYEVDESWMEG